MSDIIDDANERAEMFLEHSLQQHRKRTREDEVQIQIGDDVICIDCYGPIESQRLKFLPRAVRCVCCQQIRERSHAR